MSDRKQSEAKQWLWPEHNHHTHHNHTAVYDCLPRNVSNIYKWAGIDPQGAIVCAEV